eukprot:654527-Amorphochlora_amoeboformis.AAC.1
MILHAGSANTYMVLSTVQVCVLALNMCISLELFPFLDLTLSSTPKGIPKSNQHTRLHSRRRSGSTDKHARTHRRSASACSAKDLKIQINATTSKKNHRRYNSLSQDEKGHLNEKGLKRVPSLSQEEKMGKEYGDELHVVANTSL